ncbi:hypothetical protein Tdes44962_MAKER02666 [Teratosphaeria destructans]|uniref:Uncharacterized protein n=1 Tax=Teratosphaeria destructans TaxID=418781 RepID=A0A9W7SSR1_9PEZI|nr:hypothetical protein Tdes44962_MAKER02666 [Teratosphaeria destructans]
MIDYLESQKAAALEFMHALVYRQDERVVDLITASHPPTYHAYIGADRLPSLDDLAESPSMRMKNLLNAGENNGAWKHLHKTNLDTLLEARLKAFGTSTMCSERIIAIVQRENICAIRFREVNRTAALDKTSTLRLHFDGDKIDSVNEYIDARKSSGFERAIGAEDLPTLSKICVSM